ncbi:MAG: Ribonucleotide-transport ATP-binding protein transporter Mkl [Conexibacter sp.]|nr:Ribonucleotide-transport ATP-binding protein transporter Mkl [Conexibacter sp.]
MTGDASAASARSAAGSPGLPAPTILEALQQASRSGEPGARRLVHAGVTVRFRVRGSDRRGATLLLDRSPWQVVGDDEGGADVELTLSEDQAHRFALGRLSLTAAVAAEQIDVTGPVRRYLAVDPILRHLLASQSGVDPDDLRQARSEPPLDGAIDPDYLAIETRDLHKSFGSTAVLAGLDLTIPEGSISVILGPSGTGKSVCLQHVIGIMRPDAGDVLIRGRALSTMGRPELLRLRREIGVMFQDGALFSAMTVFDNVAFPLRQHTQLGEADVREIVAEHLRSVGLGNAGHRMPNELSGGMRKRAGLARAMALNPGIVLCDEPDSGLDPVRTALLGDLLADRHDEHGGTMVVVTHNVMLARRIADHVSVIWQGRVLESGFLEDIVSSESDFVRQFLAGSSQGPLSMDA